MSRPSCSNDSLLNDATPSTNCYGPRRTAAGPTTIESLRLLRVESNAALVRHETAVGVYHGWKKSGMIYEKYDEHVPGERGAGGEYDLQTGKCQTWNCTSSKKTSSNTLTATIIRSLSSNTSDFVCIELIQELWKYYRKHRKFNRSDDESMEFKKDASEHSSCIVKVFILKKTM
ncbi:hypothetical protein BpHYR1_046903 [Brachionus plicatilis]|uniref:Uncharacterized protein n=1 Tax=Brachionus plicatilis TaxID=10195 RepID=A0A3M7S351_BRAPC|nr:hypothetical protein BpHYR1_046903 [Brachionus plicatilis]